MNFHIMLELITLVLAFSTLVFSYPLYKKHIDVPSLFWLVGWGMWMGLFSLAHTILSYIVATPELYIDCSSDIERIVCAVLIMFCVYPGKSQDGIIFYLKRKHWLSILMPLIILTLISFAFLPDLTLITKNTTIFLKVSEIIIISIIFGRLIDIISTWAKILRIALCFILFSAICSLYSQEIYDPLFYLGHMFKVACSTTILIAVTFLWVKITTYNGNTLRQIIGVYYGSSKTRNNL